MNSKRMAKLAGLLKEQTTDYDASYDGGPGPFGDEAKEYLAKGEQQARKDKDPTGFRIEELEKIITVLESRIEYLEKQVQRLNKEATESEEQ